MTIMQRFQRLQRPFVEKRAKKKEKHGFGKNTELEKKRSFRGPAARKKKVYTCLESKAPVQVKRNINGTEFWKISDKMIVSYYMRPISFTSFKNGPFLDLSG